MPQSWRRRCAGWRASRSSTAAPVGRAVIALDGKVLRGSLSASRTGAPPRCSARWRCRSRWCSGTLIEDGSKDHGSRTAQRLIKELGLSDCLYTLDALHLQKHGRGHRRARRRRTDPAQGNQPGCWRACANRCGAIPPMTSTTAPRWAGATASSSAACAPWPPAAARDPARSLPVPGRGHAHHRDLRPRPQDLRPRAEQPALYLCTRQAGAEELARPSAATGPSKTSSITSSTRPWPRMPAASVAIPASLGCAISLSTCCGPIPDQHRSGLYRNALCLTSCSTMRASGEAERP